MVRFHFNVYFYFVLCVYSSASILPLEAAGCVAFSLDCHVQYLIPSLHIHPFFYKQLDRNRDSGLRSLLWHFRLSSCLIYNEVAYFGGCLDLFDQFETLKLFNILVAYLQLLTKNGRIFMTRLGRAYNIPIKLSSL